MEISKLKPNEPTLFRNLFIKVFDEGFTNYPPRAKKYILATWSLPKIFQKRKNKNYLFLLAKKGLAPVGYLIGKMYEDNLAVILWTGVLKSHRRQGIGGKMVARWEKWAKGKGATRLRASTSSFANESFYTHLGFKKEPLIVKNDWGMAKLVFLKNL